MNRILFVLVVVGLLAACTSPGDGGSGQPASSTGTESADAAGAAPAGGSAACNEAFASLAEMEIARLSELGDLADEVNPTIESCESIADWVASAGQVVDGEVNPNTARFLLAINCSAEQSLAATPICQEIASS